MNCPTCQTSTLITTEYESVEIDVCKTCHGVWLDENEVGAIVKNRTLKFSDEDIKNTIKSTFAGVTSSEQEKEARACPKCQKKLNVINYSYDSGIIIDICPDHHGLWLDNHELEKIQHFREYWKDNVDENLESLTKMVEKVNENPAPKGFHSLLFNLSVEVSEIMKKIKK